MAEPGTGQSPARMDHMELELAEEKHKKLEDSDLERDMVGGRVEPRRLRQ